MLTRDFPDDAQLGMSLSHVSDVLPMTFSIWLFQPGVEFEEPEEGLIGPLSLAFGLPLPSTARKLSGPLPPQHKHQLQHRGTNTPNHDGDIKRREVAPLLAIANDVDCIDRLAAAAHAALTSEPVRTHFEKFGIRPMMQQKAEMIPFIEKEISRWGDVIARAKLEKQ